MQRQAAITAYFTSKQLLLFVFELQDYLLPSSNGILTPVRGQTTVTAYLTSKQLLLLASARQYTTVTAVSVNITKKGRIYTV